MTQQERLNAMSEQERTEHVQRLYSQKRDREIRREIQRKESEYQRLLLDVDLLKFHYKYRWVPMIVSIVGLVFSLVAMVFSFLSLFLK